MRKRILLLNPPGDKLYLRDTYCSAASKANYFWGPVDLIVQSGIIAKEHDVQALDANVLQLSFEEAHRRVLEAKPDAIVFLASTQSKKSDLAFLKGIKEEAKGLLLIGSGNFLYFETRKSMEDYPFIDAVIIDFTYEDILSFMRGDLDSVDHMAFRKGKEIVVRNSPGPQIFEIPVPRHELFPLKSYRLPHTRHSYFATVMASQGCPFKCTYCYVGNIPYRRRTVENVMAELRHIRSLGIEEIFFKDFEFPVSKEFVKGLCEAMLKERLNLSWVCLARATDLSEDVVSLMKKAGCHTIQLGVESGDDGLLKRYKKGVTTAQIRNAVSICKKHKIRLLTHYILGLPGETEASAQKTIALAKELDTDYASFNIAIPIMGSNLRKEALEKGLVTEEQIEEMDSSLAYPVLETPELPKEKIWNLRNKAIRGFYLRPEFILKKLLEIRSPGQAISLFKDGFQLLKSTFKR